MPTWGGVAFQPGSFEIKVGATTQFTINKAYIDATKANLNKAKLGAKTGELTGKFRRSGRLLP